MSLDDAIKAEKAKANQETERARAAKKQAQQENEEFQRLLGDAAARLKSAAERSQTLVHLKIGGFWAALTGYAGDDERAYTAIGRYACWTVATTQSRRTSEYPLVDAPVVLVETGQMIQVFQEVNFVRKREGEIPAPEHLMKTISLDSTILTFITRETRRRSERIKAVEQKLARTIVDYGAS